MTLSTTLKLGLSIILLLSNVNHEVFIMECMGKRPCLLNMEDLEVVETYSLIVVAFAVEGHNKVTYVLWEGIREWSLAHGALSVRLLPVSHDPD